MTNFCIKTFHPYNSDLAQGFVLFFLFFGIRNLTQRHFTAKLHTQPFVKFFKF